MHDPVTKFETHRDARRREPIKQGLVLGKFQACAWLYGNPNRYTRLMPRDDRVSECWKLDIVELDIDTDSFISYELQDRVIAVLERRIAESFLAGCGFAGKKTKTNNAPESKCQTGFVVHARICSDPSQKILNEPVLYFLFPQISSSVSIPLQ